MTDPERLEAQIREVLASENNAAALSEKLFSPTGLFNALASARADRPLVVRSELFKQAQARFRQLQQTEAAAFAQAVAQAEAAMPEGTHRLKWERVEVN
jgi:hypothetical protein